MILTILNTVLDTVVCEDQSVPKDQGTHLNSLVLDTDRNSALDFNI